MTAGKEVKQWHLRMEAGEKDGTSATDLRRCARQDAQRTLAEVVVVAPSAISFNPGKYPNPHEASMEYLNAFKQSWLDAVERCKTIGFDFIDIHGELYFAHCSAPG